MNTQVTKAAPGALMPRSIFAEMAERFGMEAKPFQEVLAKTIMPSNASLEQTAAFLVVSKSYDLNPFTKEIFAFPAKGGGIQPVVSIDGWLKIINSNPHYDGMEFKDHITDKGELTAITCRIYHKHRSKPIEVTEYMDECRRGTDPWKNWPARMLRHKAVIQCARYAFGFSGIIEPDEYERMEVTTIAAPVGAGTGGLRRAVAGPKADERPIEEAQQESGGESQAVEHQKGEAANFNGPTEQREPEPVQQQKIDPPTQQQAKPVHTEEGAAKRRRPGANLE